MLRLIVRCDMANSMITVARDAKAHRLSGRGAMESEIRDTMVTPASMSLSAIKLGTLRMRRELYDGIIGVLRFESEDSGCDCQIVSREDLL